MKKFTVFMLLFLSVMINTNNAKSAEQFEEYMNQAKPCAILLYADWADNLSEVKSSYSEMQNSFAGKYNFTSINVSKEEAKAYNQKYDIYKNMPYIILYKERGKFSRYIPKDCIIDRSCIKNKMDLFAN